MENVIFSNRGGIGLVLNEDEDINDYVDKIPVVLHGTTLQPDEFTDLDGMFSGKVIYKGMLKDNSECDVMVFFLGVDGTLFSGNHYYQCFYRISENRIANKYKEGTVRDFNWINNKWK